MNKITGYFVDPENGIAEPRTIDKSLAGYYSLLRCDMIDMPERYIGKRVFTIICDDEGLLKAPAYVSAVGSDGSPMLVGPLFVVKFDGVDDVTSLSDEELDYVDAHRESGWGIVDGQVHVSRFLVGLDY